MTLKIVYRVFAVVGYTIAGVFAISTVAWIVLGITFTPTIPYFETFLARKLSGYRTMEGREIRCESWEERGTFYEVSCRFFRNGIAEETTYHAFDTWGGYIGTLDGG